jgi:hypothetical protein
MSTPAREVRRPRWIDADQTRKQEAKRPYIVAEICRRCRAEVVFAACQFSDGECVLETISKVLSQRGYDNRFADLEIR